MSDFSKLVLKIPGSFLSFRRLPKGRLQVKAFRTITTKLLVVLTISFFNLFCLLSPLEAFWESRENANLIFKYSAPIVKS